MSPERCRQQGVYGTRVLSSGTRLPQQSPPQPAARPLFAQAGEKEAFVAAGNIQRAGPRRYPGAGVIIRGEIRGQQASESCGYLRRKKSSKWSSAGG